MRPFLMLATAATLALPAFAEISAPPNWRTWSPREEIAPAFSFQPKAGADGKGAWILETDRREGLYGAWVGTFPVQGGKIYRFSSLYRATGVTDDRQSVVARVVWRDADDKPVKHGEPSYASYRPGEPPRAEPEYPQRKGTRGGWTEMSDSYLAPPEAAKAVVELYLQWQPDARVEWSNVALAEVSEMPSRKVRLATIHFQPKEGNDAARQGAALRAADRQGGGSRRPISSCCRRR